MAPRNQLPCYSCAGLRRDLGEVCVEPPASMTQYFWCKLIYFKAGFSPATCNLDILFRVYTKSTELLLSPFYDVWPSKRKCLLGRQTYILWKTWTSCGYLRSSSLFHNFQDHPHSLVSFRPMKPEAAATCWRWGWGVKYFNDTVSLFNQGFPA